MAKKTGILLLHGFGASSWEMGELTDYLTKKNIIVSNPMLAGHGTNLSDFAKTTRHEWYTKALNDYSKLAKKTDETYVAGLSTGGALALKIASVEKVAGVIAINAPVVLQSWTSRFAGIAKYFLKSVKRDLTDEEKKHYYTEFPLAAIDQLNHLLHEYPPGLRNVKSPALVIQSKNDPTVNPKSAEIIMKQLGSTRKKLEWVESDKHIITRSEERKQVFSEVYNFIK